MIRPIAALAISLGISLIAPLCAQTANTPASEELVRYASIRNEIFHAIEKGNTYLKSKQSPEGIWGDESYPAITALACTAAMRSPDFAGKPIPPYLEKAYQFILKSQKENGSIYNKGLSSYNTSVCMMALMAAPLSPEYERATLQARAYLVNQQTHFAPDSPYNGGIGYGGDDAPPVADLSNTTLALEAIRYSSKLAKDTKQGPQPDLDWQAAIDFISRCQQSSEPSKQPEETSTPADQGGFRYRPTPPKPAALPQATQRPDKEKAEQNATLQVSKSGKEEKIGRGSHDPRGPQGSRGGKGSRGGRGGSPEPSAPYGSMTYAGIQSLIYANLGKDDPRVKAALRWIASHYTLDENPGVGIDGLFYYYQAMAKALSAAGIDQLPLDDGSSIDWRQDLAAKIVSLQNADGSWANTSNRWWEKDPILVTAYCVLALEQLYNSMPQPVGR